MSSFLARKVWRLTAKGDLSHLSGPPFGALRAPLVLLDRELCRFAAIDPGSGVAGMRAARAARLVAGVEAPFASSACHLVRRGDRFFAWYWDASVVDGLLEAWPETRGAVRAPESAAYPPADGWRVLHLASGYEAQRWMDGALVGALWRPGRISSAEWAQFVRVVGGLDDAPAGPPAPLALEPDLTSPILNTLGGGLNEAFLPQAAAAGVALALGLIAYDLARLQTLDRAIDAAQAQLDETRLSGERIAAARRAIVGAAGDAARFNQAAGLIDPLVLLQAATAAPSLAGSRLRRFSLSGDRAEFTFDLPARPEAVTQAVRFLEADPMLADVSAEVDRVANRVSFFCAVTREGAAS